MKPAIQFLFIVVVLGTSCSTTHASGCTNLYYSQVGDNKIYATYLGTTYIQTETLTYLVTCTNSNTGATVYSTQNSATAYGTYGIRSTGTFTAVSFACDPQFALIIYPGDSIDNQGYNGAVVNYGSSNAACTPGPLQSDNASTCPYVSCGPPCTVCPKSPPVTCHSPCGSPIILDINGDGFHLTSAENGVMFDITGSGKLWQMGWTAKGAQNAFLALPGPDGLIDDGKELFGNYTTQAPSSDPNGFRALAVYDDPKNGGNGDGIIDARDAIFGSLRLWVDANHDGISQPEEIFTLPALGINSISLRYIDASRTDQYGNVFGYRARVNPDETTDTGKFAYDVFFKILPPSTTAAVPACAVPLPIVPKATGKN